ncbi:MAG: hypothetical protein WAL13_21540, partial [Trebonia sp.]
MPAAVATLAVLGTLAGVLAAVLGAPPRSDLSAGAAGAAPSLLNLPVVRPTSGDTPVAPGMTMGTGAHLMALAGSHPPAVAPLRRTLQADLLIVAPHTLPHSVLTAVSRLPGVTAIEQIEAVRMRINGAYTAVLGVDPSVFRTFAARPTGASNALWDGVASGGIAVSYTMGKLDKLTLGGTVAATGRIAKRLRVVAFGTMGIGGVNAVVSDSVARSLGAPAGNAIVVSMRTSDFTADAAAAGRLIPKGAGVEQLVSLITVPGGAVTVNGSGAAGAGPATEGGVAAAQLDTALRAAMSRRGLPYVWGAAGPKAF